MKKAQQSDEDRITPMVYWESVAKALKDISYDGVLNIEMGADAKGEDVWADLKEGAQFIQNVFE